MVAYATRSLLIKSNFMRKLFISLIILSSAALHSQQKDYSIQAVNFKQVRLNDNFWMPRIRTNHTVTIPASFDRCESTGRVKNFEMAAARSGKFGTTYPFDDTDIYKTIEGASFSLSLFPDKKLEAYVDTLIRKIAAAQEPDGYLYTARTIDSSKTHSWAGKERWEKERELSHELYNSGHLYEAATAHFAATGKKSLLDIALKNADLVCSVFGPGKKHVAPGHEIVEMGLVKLYRITGKKEYLETARDFIYERGHFSGYDVKNKDPYKNGAYWQDHKPVTEQDEAIGHAVRACYLYSGVADVAALTGDEKLLESVDRIWENMVSKKLYVQGGVGAVGSGERFGDNYELPNTTAYNETCAAIANVYWNHRMFLLHGDSKYIDVLEKSLYNALLSGIGLDGKSFFYSNAMQVKSSFAHRDMEIGRSGWFECSCCPTNLVRLLPSVPGYMYAQKNDVVYVNLYASSSTDLIINQRKFTIIQQNNYPFDGKLDFTISTKAALDFKLLFRIPGWAQNSVLPSDLYSFVNDIHDKVVIKINGAEVPAELEKGYAMISRKWKNDDKVEIILPMETRLIRSNDKLKENEGKLAVERGPLVYCAEWVDNGGKTSNILLPSNSSFQFVHRADLLNGVTILTTKAPVIDVSADGQTISTQSKIITFIPYYAWANRARGEMQIWFPERVGDIDLIPVANKIEDHKTKQ